MGLKTWMAGLFFAGVTTGAMAQEQSPQNTDSDTNKAKTEVRTDTIATQQAQIQDPTYKIFARNFGLPQHNMNEGRFSFTSENTTEDGAKTFIGETNRQIIASTITMSVNKDGKKTALLARTTIDKSIHGKTITDFNFENGTKIHKEAFNDGKMEKWTITTKDGNQMKIYGEKNKKGQMEYKDYGVGDNYAYITGGSTQDFINRCNNEVLKEHNDLINNSVTKNFDGNQINPAVKENKQGENKKGDLQLTSAQILKAAKDAKVPGL